eukprot:gnl/TRDRNA2_/TRDRNA2_39970_c0_seq1.p1 gnl/TRDRNA2_/TRDRNA2_39970_c0~~gnl/TRDRNA2_/TRDRNA2_39970_c0_seq1.p1  ORF type:complete len:687 (-),score=148.90 gnl/TRDRNA2_/TRDRNA2_39970_c0_seq1:84-2144(-)
MRSEAAEYLKLALTIGASVVTVRYIWSWFVTPSSRKKDQYVADAKTPSASEKAAGAGDLALEDGVWIYYGSQSGTAEGFSQELEQECAEHNLRGKVVDLEDFNSDEFAKHKCVILCVATYGEGDPTDNAVEFFQWLQDQDLPADTLKGVQFCVMGLGNRQYVNFNSCAKIADKQMERLGAVRIYERGEGDDDQNIEEDFEQWKGNGLWPALQKACGVVDNVSSEGKGESGGLDTPEETLSKLLLQALVVEDKSSLRADPLVQNGGTDVLGKWYFSACSASVVVCDELRQKPDQEAGKSTKHIEFDVKKFPALQWKTADNLEVLPSNPEEDVAWFAERVGVKEHLDSQVTFKRAPGVERAVRKPLPTPCTVKDALANYCELGTAPTKAAAKRFASLAQAQDERAALQQLLQDTAAYQWLLSDSVKLSLREFFELFLPSAEVTLSSFLQLCPRQKSRPYTIASSSKEDPHRIGICVSMVQAELPDMATVIKELEARGHKAPGAAAVLDAKRRFRGSCSSMLCNRTSRGDKLWIFARASSFRLPRRTTTPIVMIGAGTGLAPFRAFVREFRAEKGARTKTILFFGCTKSTEDFIYREELQEALTLEPPALKELVTAFSREQSQKVYVQHRLKERGAEVAKMVREDGAYIYVCGAVSMGQAVREELAAVLGSSDHVQRLLNEGRIVEELW